MDGRKRCRGGSCEARTGGRRATVIDTERLQRIVGQNIERLCRELFSFGVRDGAEWKIADTGGAKGESLGICLTAEKAGVWHDRATGEGGPFVELLMANRNLPFPQAVEVIERCLGVNLQAEHAGTNGEIRFDLKLV